jgi:hypothetical protein
MIMDVYNGINHGTLEIEIIFPYDSAMAFKSSYEQLYTRTFICIIGLCAMYDVRTRARACVYRV